MSIEYAILGLLSLRSLTGYDIKKIFAETSALYWSDNNNQIYRTLLNLHRQDLVTREIQFQENHPPRKIYTITEKGLSALKKWVLSIPEAPQPKNAFLIQLAWADPLEQQELDALLEKYEDEVLMQFLMCQAQAQQKKDCIGRIPHQSYIDISAARTPRENYLWKMILENWITYYENELAWVRKVRRGISVMSNG